MIEAVVRHILPTRGIVATSTGIAKAAAVRIAMAGAAIAKAQAGKLHKRGGFFFADLYTRRLFTMTLDARNLFVATGEGILRQGVRELRRGFPRLTAMAALAILAELCTMFIAVTGKAALLQSEEGC